MPDALTTDDERCLPADDDDDPLHGKTRAEAIQHFVAMAEARTAAGSRDAPAGGSSCDPDVPPKEKKQRMAREDADARRTRVLGDDYLNAALSGQHLESGDRRTDHPACKCKCRRPDGSACWAG